MNKSEILNRIRNRLTLPRTLFQMLIQLDPQYKLAVDEIDTLIKELENENPDDRSI